MSNIQSPAHTAVSSIPFFAHHGDLLADSSYEDSDKLQPLLNPLFPNKVGVLVTECHQRKGPKVICLGLYWPFGFTIIQVPTVGKALG